MIKVKNITLKLLLIIMIVVISVVMSTREKQVTVNYQKELPIFRVDTEENMIALTFDINWAEEEHLYEILEVLDKYDVKATFFVMGGWVNYTEENKEKLVKIYEGGHEIGNHSYIHPSFTNISTDRMREEIEKTEQTIEDLVGCKTKVFRFPSGDFNEAAIKYVQSLGYACIQWDVDSVDWKGLGADVEYKKVMDNVKSGSILLFHNNAKYTVGNLDRIIKELQEKGYSFCTISNLIYDQNSYVDENGEQHKNNY